MEKDAFRKRFDSSDAIILPLVQKGKVEETILESFPQLIIQLLNTALLGQLQNMPLLTIFSISFSVMSLTSTIWYYAYWNLFEFKYIRDVPSSLSLYNYKLSGVTDGPLSFSKAMREVAEIADVELARLSRASFIDEAFIEERDAGVGLLDQGGSHSLDAIQDATAAAADAVSKDRRHNLHANADTHDVDVRVQVQLEQQQQTENQQQESQKKQKKEQQEELKELLRPPNEALNEQRDADVGLSQRGGSHGPKNSQSKAETGDDQQQQQQQTQQQLLELLLQQQQQVRFLQEQVQQLTQSQKQ